MFNKRGSEFHTNEVSLQQTGILNMYFTALSLIYSRGMGNFWLSNKNNTSILLGGYVDVKRKSDVDQIKESWKMTHDRRTRVDTVVNC